MTRKPHEKKQDASVARELGKLRERIDEIDEQLVSLLNQRAKIALEVGDLKAEVGMPVFAPARERELLARLQRHNPGPLDERALRAVYREILSISRSMQHRLRVAYLGPKATFTHQAARAHFGVGAELGACASIRETFAEVERKVADFGVVPVESSLEGMVTHTLDLLTTSELGIVGEVLVDISHNLLNRSGDLGTIERICSHPHALAACRGFLDAKLPTLPREETSSTAAAAQLAARDDTAAAIASELSAELYGLAIAAPRIEDVRGAMTRFVVIGHAQPPATGADRTSIVFALRDAPGVLHAALTPFADAAINLSRIESRPSRRKAWDYLFFIDLEGHRDDEPVRAAMERLAKSCVFLRVLGSYPRAG